MSKKKKQHRTKPRVPRGFRDLFVQDVAARRSMLDTLLGVYERFGFEQLETPAVEYVDVLGKNLPESDEPSGGVFSWRDDDEQWIALRYDLTAPLSRVYAQYHQSLPTPFRRCQVGPVYRQEKPGPGRYREFYQCDFDTVGTASIAADAEVCAVLSTCFEELGIGRGNYVIRVNNRKVLNGVLDAIGLPIDDESAGQRARLTVLRAIDKLDRLGTEGVRLLLGTGRKDESGDFTPGAGLSDEQIAIVMAYVGTSAADRPAVCRQLRELVGDSAVGDEGVRELEEIDALLDAMALGSDRVIFDPSVVRGLAYYTGPVFEAELTFTVEDEGSVRPFGAVAGGGRYDDLVKRFTGSEVPATGASIGVDRLLTALSELGKLDTGAARRPVVVTVMDRERLVDYQAMVSELRSAGIAAELYLGTSGFRAQMKYADKRGATVAIIAGSDEFERGEVTLKDLGLGAELSKDIEDRDEWTKARPAQVTAARSELVEQVRAMLAAGQGDGEPGV